MSVLMNNESLVFQRDLVAGYWDVSGRWVEGSKTPITIKGNLQPYTGGKKQITLPEGIFAEDAWILYSKEEVRTADQFTPEKADTTTIDGREYICHKSANWSRVATTLSKHYKTLLIRKDKSTGGTL